MSELHFAEPRWVHLLWIVLVFVGLLGWLERRGSDALDRLVGGPLQKRLLSGPSRGQKIARLLFLGATGTFLTLALMRPQWGLELVERKQAGAEIMIALDVSRSMLAEDVAPNRLERSKAEIGDLLSLLDGDQVGLIAFAGRASVLSPLTPDFGFLRTSLDNAGPGSVTRGGTRLEEPIRKAIEGFGGAGDVSRSILLITDGEDHDSFPLEAAKDAAERGIRILAIGFGAESGADIPVTDPDSGARTFLKDADGVIVSSRLDGELLREMALLTDGAYIPAGTGLLDLESIYQRHIQPLTRGQLDKQARVVRRDVFQWAVLLGLLALVAATLSTARAAVGTGGGDTLALALLLASSASVLSLTATWAAHAQQPPPASPHQTGTLEAKAETVPGVGAANKTLDVPDDPRDAYNQGLSELESGNAEAATHLLETARERAGTDGETRFRSTYNLGWAEVSVADHLLESEPSKALERLHRAAGWFREAVDLRPGHEDARYNLEIVMQRALALADSMAASEQENLQEALDGLIRDQRAFLGVLRAAVEAQQADTDANVGPELRRAFRDLAARELTVLADAEQTSERAAQELEALRAKDAKERTPEEALRAARLETIVGHLHHGRERIAQARVRLRKAQGERAYRRASAGLGALQRARDQLLDPVAQLDALLADGTEVARLTALRAELKRGIKELDEPVETLGWLTSTYLVETQAHLESRTAELHLELASGLTAQRNETAPAEGTQQTRLLEQLEEATPLIEDARDGFGSAASALGEEDFERALIVQGEALEALAAARERFLDLRRLIDLVYGEEQRVAALLANASNGDADGTPTTEAVALGSAVHGRNVERTVRLGGMLSEAMVDSLDPDAASAGAASGGAPKSGESERYEQAYELLRKAQDSMHAASRKLGEVEHADGGHLLSAQAVGEAGVSVQTALTHLEALRRLFFSVLEHLQDTARRQQRLADETESVATLNDPTDKAATAAKAGPLGHRQAGLASNAEAIAEALKTQAASPPPAADPAKPPTATVDAERLTQAADLVAAAGASMNAAAQRLDNDPPGLDPARNAQKQALETLVEAIDLLQEDQDTPQSDDPQQQAEAGDQGASQDSANEGSGDRDLAQLLQGVRDREAQRREERAQGRARGGYEPVEKDW